MKETTPIYVQLGYNESLESKKRILSSEVNLLNLIKIIKRYYLLKQEESKIKSKINKSTRELKAKTKEMQTAFPFLKVPSKVGSINLNERKERRADESLENELRKIQEKLKAIEGR